MKKLNSLRIIKHTLEYELMDDETSVCTIHEADSQYVHALAAAPEMLAFLEKLSKEADSPADNVLAKELFALIAKARGES